ncbi:MAG: MCE family protein [Aquificae bacterium]|nr:MCE family protein [Aquificota bacterium]
MKLSTEAKLGLFVVFTALSFAFIILTFGEIPIFKEKTKEYIVYFDDVAGLSKGAEVRVAGVRAGKVRDVLLEGDKVKVIFEVQESISIYRDASASIGTLGLMGDKYLALDPGNPQTGELPPGSVIKRTKVVSDTDRLISQLTQTAEEFRRVAINLNAILEENRTNLRQTVENLNNLLSALNELTLQNKENINLALHNLRELTQTLNRELPVLLDTLTKLAKDADTILVENREDIRAIAYNLSVVLEQVRDDLPVLVENLKELSVNLNTIVKTNKTNINKTLVSLRETTRNLSSASRKLDRILEDLRKGRGTLGKLLKDEELYVNINKGVKSLGKMGEVVERTRLYVGLRGELYREGDSKGILTVKLQPDEKKYYLLEVVGDSRGRVYREEYLDGREYVKKEFKPEFTLQYARNFRLFGRTFTLRGGLKESTGGIGADYYLSPERYIFADIWDFGRKDRPQDENLKPNLQLGIHWHITRNFYVRFGGDDLLNDNLRGFFGGAGFLFVDEDLKYLLGGMGVPLP